MLGGGSEEVLGVGVGYEENGNENEGEGYVTGSSRLRTPRAYTHNKHKLNDST